MKVDLPALGMPEQADVGQHLQLELEFARFARLAARELARRAVGAGFEMQVAEPALAALGDAGRVRRAARGRR